MKKPYNLYSKEKGIMTGKGKIQNTIRGFVWLLLAISLVTVWPATSSQAADYTIYIDGTGDDDLGTGTLGAPWRTIQRAFTEISALNMTTADTLVVYVGPGTYSVGNGEVDSASTYMVSTPNIAIKGAGSSSTINGSGLTGWTSGFTIAADNITIAELQFMGFSSAGVSISSGDNVKVLDCDFMSNGSGIALHGSSSDLAPEFIGNIIDDSSNNGIHVESNGSGIISPMIKGNVISGSGSNGISLFIMSSTGSMAPRIYGNGIKSNAFSGIYMYADMGTLSPFVSSNRITANPTGIYINAYMGSAFPVIRNNLISEPHPSNPDFAINIQLSTGSVTPEIIHNTLDGGGNTAIGINIPNSPNVIPEIRYNIITNFSQYGINNEQTGTPEIDYNNVYGNVVNYFNFDPAGTGNISVDPLYDSVDFSIPANSPCVDAIPSADEASNLAVLVADDLIGTSRPRASAAGQSRDYDMGCYEYPYQQYTFTMPGGVGLPGDYRLMTLPLSDKSGGSFFSEFESAFGTYDPKIWRIFAYIHGTDPAEYMEINDATFGEYFSSFQGSAFWVISRSGSIAKDYHTFGGNNFANKRPYTIGLSPGWNLISLPWADNSVNPDIILANVVVEGMDSKYYLLDLENDLTQRAVWSYGLSGYRELANPTDTMEIGQGYWIYVSSPDGVQLMIPPDNSGNYFALGKYSKSKKGVVNRNVKNLTPPQPPGSALEAEGGNGCFIGSVMGMH